ncbi:MAG: hypothetical protein KatS3mg115_1350 [Candidatus Poribacteria bacterium]|nr:MAG: hypothetical protein KatS3mg115_1350 [Candidatus Poribacteria bacterium]
MDVVMFSKHLQSLSIVEAARAALAIGFDGLDLTVRPGGHIPPDRVRQELPRAVEALERIGARVPMVTTAITDRDEIAEATFSTLQEVGIRYAKLGYWRYRGFGHLREQVQEVRAALARLEPLLLETGVTACLHIHSGDDLTASAHVVAQLLEGRDPRAFGAYVDPGHMTVEGGKSGWKIGMDALKDWIRLVAIKSFAWYKEDLPDGTARWTAKLYPLRGGIVRWNEVFECLRAIRFDGVISFHSEYQGAGSWKDLSVSELLEQTREDYEYLRPYLGR